MTKTPRTDRLITVSGHVIAEGADYLVSPYLAGREYTLRTRRPLKARVTSVHVPTSLVGLDLGEQNPPAGRVLDRDGHGFKFVHASHIAHPWGLADDQLVAAVDEHENAVHAFVDSLWALGVPVVAQIVDGDRSDFALRPVFEAKGSMAATLRGVVLSSLLIS